VTRDRCDDLSDYGYQRAGLKVADTFEVRRWILGFGAEAEVLQPACAARASTLSNMHHHA
jgi:hypothetical protein